MKKFTLYHGTDCVFQNIDLKKSMNRRDFGTGFYTTTINAQDDTMVTVNRYVQGVYTVEEAIKRSQFSRANDQVSFHTERAIQCLKLIRRYAVGL